MKVHFEGVVGRKKRIKVEIMEKRAASGMGATASSCPKTVESGNK